MSLINFLARVTGFHVAKRAETMNYEDVFNGDASAPATTTGHGAFLSGRRPPANDVDAYFKDVFAGSAF